MQWTQAIQWKIWRNTRGITSRCVCLQKTLFSRFYYGWNQSFSLMGLFFHTLNCCPSMFDVLQTGSDGSKPLIELHWVYKSYTVWTSVHEPLQCQRVRGPDVINPHSTIHVLDCILIMIIEDVKSKWIIIMCVQRWNGNTDTFFGIAHFEMASDIFRNTLDNLFWHHR